MKLLSAAAMAATYLAILWGPALLVARRVRRAGNRWVYRPLRLILPAQLAATFALLFTADEIGLPNPAGLFVAITLAMSVAGAVACRMAIWYSARGQG